MINAAITLLADQLNSFLRRKNSLHNDLVVVSNLYDMEKEKQDVIKNKLVVNLVNIQRITTPQLQAQGIHQGNSVVEHEPPLFLNLYLLFAAHFDCKNYSESLATLSDTLGFFQRKPTFDHYNSPCLDAGIEKLAMRIENLTLHELSNLWSMMGSKYCPSLLYQVQLITYYADDIKTTHSAIASPTTEEHH
ncbi:DUF4255 domain-containing protein [Zooshikella sp. RANM57]|uniref:DUF4255 domain-containing protein n=1 Tax=Zooshikella sp. RANM57 TaxID=3425863 RepID=UPI003D6FBEAC